MLKLEKKILLDTILAIWGRVNDNKISHCLRVLTSHTKFLDKKGYFFYLQIVAL